MSFGFSVGDFLAGANLAYRLIRALSETRGARMEYQEVIDELGCIQQTFLQVEHMSSSNIFCQATINAISHIMNSSIDVMARFFEQTEKYRQSLSSNGGQSLAAESWRKIGWSLFKKEELTSLRDTLQTRLTAINILVSTASSQNQYITPQAVVQFQTSGFGTQTPHQSSDSSSVTTIAAVDGPLGGKREEAYTKIDDHTQAHMQRGAFSEEVQYIKEERNSLEQTGREIGEHHRRKAAELDAVQALARLGLLQSHPPSPEKKKKPIKYTLN